MSRKKSPSDLRRMARRMADGTSRAAGRGDWSVIRQLRVGEGVNDPALKVSPVPASPKPKRGEVITARKSKRGGEIQPVVVDEEQRN